MTIRPRCAFTVRQRAVTYECMSNGDVYGCRQLHRDGYASQRFHVIVKCSVTTVVARYGHDHRRFVALRWRLPFTNLHLLVHQVHDDGAGGFHRLLVVYRSVRSGFFQYVTIRCDIIRIYYDICTLRVYSFFARCFTAQALRAYGTISRVTVDSAGDITVSMFAFTIAHTVWLRFFSHLSRRTMFTIRCFLFDLRFTAYHLRHVLFTITFVRYV